MELKEVQEFIKSNAEKPEVQNYIKGFITPDGIKTFIETDEGQKLIQPKIDQHVTRAIETWKTNNLQKINEEYANKVVLEKYPKETEEQKRLHKLETDLANETSKRLKAEMTINAASEATSKGLPPESIEFVVGNDPDSTKAKIEKFEQMWKNALKTEIDKVFKQYGRLPENGSQQPAGLFTQAEVQKMSQNEILINREKIHQSMKHW